MPTKRRFWVIVSIVAMLALALLERRAVVGFMLSTGLSVVTGYGVSIGEMRVTRSHAALFDVHVTHGVDPVLDADRIDVYYNLRDLFPGSAHRFGLLGVTIDRPRITVVRRPDGSYNISTGPGRRPIAAPGQTRVNGTPLEYYARVRNGSAVLVDASSYYADGRRVELRNIDANLSVKSDARTHYVVSGAFVDVKDQPFKAVGTVDYNRGYALHHITASALPMRALANFFINSPAAHVLAGTTRDLDASIFALGLQPGLPVNYHLSARARVNDAQIYVKTLAQPVDHIHGVVQVFDGGFAAKELGATIAGIPLRIAGGIYDFNDPKFRLGIEGTGDMRAFKSAITFARTYPLAGPMHLRVLVEGTINDPVLLIGFRSPRMWYDRIPLDRLNGVASIFGGNVDFIPLSVTYSGIGVDIHGTMDITGRSVKSKVELHFDSDASNVPYLRALIGHEPVTGDILLDGVDTNFVARGYLADPRNLPVFSGFFSLSPQGYGQIGPMWMRAPGGGSLVLAYILDRPRGDSAFWLSAHGVRLSQANEDAFPGLQMPILPLDRGYIVSADLAGGGSGHAVSMAGTADIHRLVVSHFPIGDVRADFGGTLDHLDMPRIDARGTWGRMRAQAAFVNGTFAVHGDVDGDLAALQPYMGGVSARGKMHGPIALAVAGNDIVVQAHGTQLERASLSGIPIEAFDGTLAVEGNRVRIYSAKAQVGGAHTVAAGTLDPGRSGIAVSTADAGPPLLATLGVPLEEGRIVAAGTFGESAGAPSFAGNVALESARAAGVPVAGSAMIDLRGDAVRMTAATGVLGAVFGRFDGSVGALRSGQPAYDLQAHVPVAEIGDVVSALHVPGYAATGSFSANFHVGGAGTQPQITGPVEIPVGNVNGLGFGDARAQLSASPSEIRVEHGSVLVGTTRTQVNASAGLSSGTSSVAVFAAHADLSDFNDFFATGDTLAGRGNVALAFFRTPTVFRTAGDVDVADFRYRRLPIGDTDADWSGANNHVRARLRVGGTHGTFEASGSADFAASPSIAEIITHSQYNAVGRLQGLDLTTWLPAIGFPQVPITGRVDAHTTLRGRYPHLVFQADAALRDGTIGRIPIDRMQLNAVANGRRISVSQVALAIPGVSAHGAGVFGFRLTDPIAFSAQATTTDIPMLVSQFTRTPMGITGEAQSSFTIAGSIASPTFSAGLELSNADIRGVAVPHAVGSFALRGRSVVVKDLEANFTKGSLAVAGELPLELSPLAIGPPGAPFNFDFFARALDVGTFTPLLPAGTKLGGIADGHVAIGGTVRAPVVNGQLALTDGSYTSGFETTPITKAAATLSFLGTKASLSHLHAALGRGTIDGDGDIAINRGQTQALITYRADMTARGAQLNFPEYGSGTLDGRITLTKGGPGLALASGSVTATDTIIPFTTLLRSAGGAPQGPNAGPPPPLPFNVGFDLDLTAGSNVAVRANALEYGVDIGARGRVHLAGTLANPTMDGTFDASGGSLTFVGTHFKIQRGNVTFDPTSGIVPQLYVIATSHVQNPDPDPSRNPTGYADITIRVTGFATNPQLSFESNPPGYSEGQIIGMLTPIAVISGIQFDATGQPVPAGQLAGAPPPTSAQPLPPGAISRQNGMITVGQEAFNILNARFATSLLSPLESAFGGAFGLQDLNVTVGYGGTLGFSLRKSIADRLSAVYAESFGYPQRQTFGVEYNPNAFTAADMTFYIQNTATPLFSSFGVPVSTNVRVTTGQAVQGNTGFTFLYQRLLEKVF